MMAVRREIINAGVLGIVAHARNAANHACVAARPAEERMPISLHGIERALRAALQGCGRVDLAERAVEGVRFTDDGSTVYVHIFMRPDWPHYREGDAYPLAFADHPDLCTLTQWRAFLREARLLLDDDLGRIIRWLDGG
jgi:hypothetical protein